MIKLNFLMRFTAILDHPLPVGTTIHWFYGEATGNGGSRAGDWVPSGRPPVDVGELSLREAREVATAERKVYDYSAGCGFWAVDLANHYVGEWGEGYLPYPS